MKKILSVLLAVMLTLQAVCAFAVQVDAASTLTITSPEDGDWLELDDLPKLKWNAVTGAAGYRISIRRMSNNELILSNQWTTSTSFSLSDYITVPQTTYKIWVGAMSSKSDSGSAAFTSDSVTVKTEALPPTIEDIAWEDKTYDSLTLSMNITKDNGSSITDSGFYLLLNGEPTSKATKYSFKKYGDNDATSKGYKELTITGLKPSTSYRFWGYARNDAGTTTTKIITVSTDKYECPHTSGVYTASSPSRIRYVDTGDAEQHKEIWYYDELCKYCDEVVNEEAVTEIHYAAHEFVAGVCKWCKHALACKHTKTHKDFYKITYEIVDETKHKRYDFYHPVCDSCGEITDNRTLFDTTEEAHTFSGNTCTECGYIKAEELSLTVTTPETNVTAGSAISVTATAAGGAGSYKFAFSLYRDGVKLDETEYSSMSYWSAAATAPGTYYFGVSCKDGDGTVVKGKTSDITVAPAASEGMSLYASNAVADSDRIASLAINVANNSGFKSLKFTLRFDEDNLQVNDVKLNSGSLGDSDLLWRADGGELVVNCFAMSDYSSVCADEGKLLTITFDASSAFVGRYPVTISHDAEDVFDGDGNNIPLEVSDAVIVVEEGDPAPEILMGDVNGDGKINGMDVTLIRRYIAGGYTLNNFNRSAADVNHDGRINGMDVTLIRRYIAGGYGVVLN